MRDLIRVSELSLWLKCRRRAYLQYEMGYDKDAVVMGVGRVVHAMLNQYYTGAPFEEADEKTARELHADDLIMCQKMMETYVTEVEEEGLDVGQNTVEGEKRYELEVGGLTLTGQIDALVHDEVVGGIIVRDHKTVGKFMNTSPRDFQLMSYAVMAYDAGFNVKAIEHNQVKRNKRTTRANPPFIRRVPHTVTTEAIESHRRQLANIVYDYRQAMQHAEQSGLGVESAWLWAKGSNECDYQCPFADGVCGMIDDGEDYQDVLSTEYHQRESDVSIG